jgi:putative SOS response-associated peptidase YedK
MWLDPGFQDSEMLKRILRPYPSEEIEMYPVSSKINSVKTDSATNIMPIDD